MNLERSTITQKIVVNAPPKEVYETYLDKKKHSGFTQSKASIKPVVGSRFNAWDGYIQGKNLILEKDQK